MEMRQRLEIKGQECVLLLVNSVTDSVIHYYSNYLSSPPHRVYLSK